VRGCGAVVPLRTEKWKKQNTFKVQTTNQPTNQHNLNTWKGPKGWNSESGCVALRAIIPKNLS
jgi:hypothetical protein